MEHLSEELIIEILKRITRTCDLNSLSLVSKQLYTIDADLDLEFMLEFILRSIYVGCGLGIEALPALFSRFPNLHKVEINYSGWAPGNGNQIDNQGLRLLSFALPLLNDITLSFCSEINDSGLAGLTNCKMLMSIKLKSIPEITSRGLFSLAIGCKTLSSLHLNNCKGIASSIEWLVYLGNEGSLEELVVKNCKGIGQYHFLKFGPGWMKLQKFEFENEQSFWSIFSRDRDPSYKAHTYSYDILCEGLKDLRLVRIITEPEGPEIGLRFLLGKCRLLEKLSLEYVSGLIDNDMIALSQTCKNLKSISLWLKPEHYNVGDDIVFRTGFTDESLKALALNCPFLQDVQLTFTGCEHWHPPEIGFTQEGLVMLVQSCPIRILVLNGALFFDDEGMKGLSSAPFLETLTLMDIEDVTDQGMRFIVQFPCLINLTLRYCKRVTDVGMTNLVHAQKLWSLVVGGCPKISEKGVQGAAKSVCYEVNCENLGHYLRIWRSCQVIVNLLAFSQLTFHHHFVLDST